MWNSSNASPPPNYCNKHIAKQFAQNLFKALLLTELNWQSQEFGMDATNRAFGFHLYETKGNLEIAKFILKILFTDVPSN